MRIRATVLMLLTLATAARAQGTQPTGAEDPYARIEEQLRQAQLRAYTEMLEQSNRRVNVPRSQVQEEPRVTISRSRATAREVLDDFVAQGGIQILLDERHIDNEVDRYDVNYRGLPFRQALNAFMDSSDLYFVEDTPTLIRLARRVRVTYSFRNADLAAVIEIIAKTADANVIIHPQVSGPITLTVTDRPWDAVLEQVVNTAEGDFALVREEWDILRVVPRRDLLRQTDTQLFQLRYLYPPALHRGRMGTSLNTFVRSADMAQPANMTEWINSFPLLQVIQSVMSVDPTSSGSTRRLLGAVNYDPSTNAVTVTDTRPVLNRIADIITTLDVPPSMVRIAVTFIATRNQELFDFGIQWSRGIGEDQILGFSAQSNAVTPLTTEALFLAGGGVSNAIGTSHLPFGLGGSSTAQWINEFQLQGILRMFEQDGYSRVRQEPYLATLDGMEATIFSGATISFAQETSSTSSLGTVTTTFEEAENSPVSEGFQLLVIPNVVRNTNTVIMTIVPSLSDVELQNFPSDADIRIRLPQITQQVVVTRLMVESGQTVVMGGLVNESQTVTDQGIPFLQDLPAPISWLFKQRVVNDTRENLILLLTPQIIRGVDPTSEEFRLALEARRQQEMGPHMDLMGEAGVQDAGAWVDEERRRQLEALRQWMEQGQPTPAAQPVQQP